ncbi:UNVERIFIED_CONTAM: hypothetical protein Sradi_0227200 [Sesamum radiatum]|uniref:DDE Tnp4 domain-containing protein n=1 Tax=Sesamum radiatum TaxID=300843 RepID=A0AAW2W0X2_SESRA
MMEPSQPDEIAVAVPAIMIEIVKFLFAFYVVYKHSNTVSPTGRRVRAQPYIVQSRTDDRHKFFRSLFELSDAACIDNLCMDRNAFGMLCYLLEHQGGLKSTIHVNVSEQVAMFLSVLAHPKKNIVKFDFKQLGWTVSHFNNVLAAVLKLHHVLLATPNPIGENCSDPRWKWFKGCLGALDGTHILVHVPTADRGRYRTRKGQIAVNVLGVCDQNMQFIYVLTGWEGSASNIRVLRDAISRPNSLKVPTGCYYLCDKEYTNTDGFLTPYRGVRYHQKEWKHGSLDPQNKEELFNLRHGSARNVIDRTFDLLKSRWGVLTSLSHYPISVQNKIIIACCLLHNFIRKEMSEDPMEAPRDEFVEQSADANAECIPSIGTNQSWSKWRDDLANSDVH